LLKSFLTGCLSTPAMKFPVGYQHTGPSRSNKKEFKTEQLNKGLLERGVSATEATTPPSGSGLAADLKTS